MPRGQGGIVTATISGWQTDPTDSLLIPPIPDPVDIADDGTFVFPALLANDNTDIPSGSTWTITVSGLTGVEPYTEAYAIDYENGATQDISQLTPIAG